MSEIKLFNISNRSKGTQIKAKSLRFEKEIQEIVEKNLEDLFGIRLLASEYIIDGGRVDTLGVDENDCPVIIEYKLDSNNNVINQGLYYLDWFMEHKADFDILCREKLGSKIEIDWNNPRLICIATDFNKYDDNAIKQINRNIELIRYTLFENDYLMIQLASAVGEKKKSTYAGEDKYTKDRIKYQIGKANKEVVGYLEELDEYILELGEDIQKKELKNYWAYKTIRNIACILIATKEKLGIYLAIDYKDIENPKSNVRDVKNIGHWGTGNTEVLVSNDAELEYTKELVAKVYRGI